MASMMGIHRDQNDWCREAKPETPGRSDVTAVTNHDGASGNGSFAPTIWADVVGAA